MQKSFRYYIFLPTILTVVVSAIIMIPSARAEEPYVITKSNTKIQGSIKYTVVGRYHAEFQDFKGHIGYDPVKKQIQSVQLVIDTASIRSSFPLLDRIVRSPQILDAQRYPRVTFESEQIEPFEKGYRVTGQLNLHGVTRTMTFLFAVNSFPDQSSRVLAARGNWVINRKDFGIIWNPFLDKGGILVGNYLTVNWQIKTSL